MKRARTLGAVSPAVTTHGPKDEPYPEFQKRTKADQERVDTKVTGLDDVTPYCDHCGQTTTLALSGARCRENNSPMLSRWGREKANNWWPTQGFGGHWWSQVEALAALLDRTRALGFVTRPSQQMEEK